MEDTLRDDDGETSVNNGERGLNPCFNGRYSQRTRSLQDNRYVCWVLILVLMEDTLRDYKCSCSTKWQPNVLILVLMEDTLRVYRS